MSHDLNRLIQLALSEDMPSGDITTDCLELQNEIGRAKLVAKEDLVLSGTEVFCSTFKSLSEKIQCQWFFTNGQFIFKNQTICVLNGPLAALLKAERVALNFLGRLSGIASLTKCFVDQLQGSKTQILDTRKTTPLFRELEKKAVVDGGGYNHRMNLSDAVLLKENHLLAVGGIKNAVQQIRKKRKGTIEVEVQNLAEVREAVDCQVDRILLDNMNNDLIRDALLIIPSTIQTEASGNMSLERVATIAKLGVDFISVGAITHSAPCADFSLLFEHK